MLSIIRLDLKTQRFEVLRCSSDLSFDEGYLSFAQPIEFPTEGARPPMRSSTPEEQRLPSPNGREAPALSLQPWRANERDNVDAEIGDSVLDEPRLRRRRRQLRGSTGYGREYRERLKGQWGIVDVDDCVNAAKYLVSQGLVDGERVAIRGGSAGGYTTLCALTFRRFFKAGASYFGVSDLEALDKDTHKFESRYNRSLIGPYPERRDLYYARSPIHFAEKSHAR